MSVSIVIDASDMADAMQRLRPLLDFDAEELMTGIAALGESQTRRRITDEKSGPDGTPWPPNAAGTPVLVATGQHLLASVAWRASATEAEWGAAWEYAHVHQDGAVIVPKNGKAMVFEIGGSTVTVAQVTIPARPFVGLSPDNEAEILDLVTDYLGGLL